MKHNDVVLCVARKALREDNCNYMDIDDVNLGQIYIVTSINNNYSGTGETSIALEGKWYSHLISNFELIGQL